MKLQEQIDWLKNSHLTEWTKKRNDIYASLNTEQKYMSDSKLRKLNKTADYLTVKSLSRLIKICIIMFLLSSCMHSAKTNDKYDVVDTIMIDAIMIDTMYIKHNVIATCYHAVVEQCDSSFLVTASGSIISGTATAYKHRYVAVSRDLLQYFPYHSLILIENAEHNEYNGIWQVEDTMNERYSNTIDFLINPGMKLMKSTCQITLL